jgi:negative regulator of flagellin synthesis FlgM
MKVKDTSEIRPVDANRTPESKRTQGARVAHSDTVSTESRAELDAAVAAARQGMGQNRTARLEAIEAAIRQGTFKPDPQRIAQQILDDAELTAVLQSMLKR